MFGLLALRPLTKSFQGSRWRLSGRNPARRLGPEPSRVGIWTKRPSIIGQAELHARVRRVATNSEASAIASHLPPE
jgi:hypothetical protein